MVRFYKWLTGSAELMLGIPLVGGAFILSTGWSALGVMLLVHMVGLIISVKTQRSTVGHIFGLLASIFGVVPFIGMILHLLTGVVLVLEAFGEEKKYRTVVVPAEPVIEPKQEEKQS